MARPSTHAVGTWLADHLGQPQSRGEVEELRQVLTDGSRWHKDSQDDVSPCAEQAYRDNAIRLLVSMELAEPFTRGPAPRVLECGAGSLYTIDALRWRFGDSLELFAVDHPDEDNDELRAQLAARDVRFSPHDLLGDGVPWPEVKFDLIILAEVVEHLPPTELPQLLRRLAGSLSDTGALLMSSPNSQAIYNVLSLAIGNGQAVEIPSPRESGGYGHIRVYGRKEVEELLGYAGLRLDQWRLCNWQHAHPWPGAPIRDRIRLGIQRSVPRVVPRWRSGWICTGVPAAAASSS